jgi:hypothetical protein
MVRERCLGCSFESSPLGTPRHSCVACMGHAAATHDGQQHSLKADVAMMQFHCCALDSHCGSFQAFDTAQKKCLHLSGLNSSLLLPSFFLSMLCTQSN